MDILKMSKNEKSFNRYVKNWKWHCETINFQKRISKKQKRDHKFFWVFLSFPGFVKMSKNVLKNLYFLYKHFPVDFLVTIYGLIFFKTRKKHVSIMLRKQNGNKWKHKSINARKPVFNVCDLWRRMVLHPHAKKCLYFGNTFQKCPSYGHTLQNRRCDWIWSYFTRYCKERWHHNSHDYFFHL